MNSPNGDCGGVVDVHACRTFSGATQEDQFQHNLEKEMEMTL